MTALFAQWRKANTPRLKAIQPGDHPKALIEALSEDLLDTFRQAPLLDPYDVYQHLMDYWAATMQDDVYLLVRDGWKAVQTDGRDRGKPNTDLIPEPLIVARYFAREQADIEKLEADRDAITRQMEEMDEEHGGEDGLLFEARNDKGKLTQGQRQRSSQGDHVRQGRSRGTPEAGRLPGPYREGGRRRQAGEGRAEGARCPGRAKYARLDRGGDPDPGGRR